MTDSVSAIQMNDFLSTASLHTTGTHATASLHNDVIYLSQLNSMASSDPMPSHLNLPLSYSAAPPSLRTRWLSVIMNTDPLSSSNHHTHTPSILTSLTLAESRWQTAHNTLSSHYATLPPPPLHKKISTPLFLTLPNTTNIPGLLSLVYNHTIFKVIATYLDYEAVCSLRVTNMEFQDVSWIRATVERCSEPIVPLFPFVIAHQSPRLLSQSFTPPLLLHIASVLAAPPPSLAVPAADILEEIHNRLVLNADHSITVEICGRRGEIIALDTTQTLDAVLFAHLGCTHSDVAALVHDSYPPPLRLLPAALSVVLLDPDFRNVCELATRIGGNVHETAKKEGEFIGNLERLMHTVNGGAVGDQEPEARDDEQEHDVIGGLWGEITRSSYFGTKSGKGAVNRGGGYLDTTVGDVAASLFHPQRLGDLLWAMDFCEAFEEAFTHSEVLREDQVGHVEKDALQQIGRAGYYGVYLYAMMKGVLRICAAVRDIIGEEKMEVLWAAGKETTAPIKLRCLAAVVQNEGMEGRREFERLGLGVERVKERYNEFIAKVRKRERKQEVEKERKMRLYGGGKVKAKRKEAKERRDEQQVTS